VEGLLKQLGIDWKLFLSQAANFFILLIVLKIFVYKPILQAVKERRKKIQEGLEKAKEADIRLKEVDQIAAGKLKETYRQSTNIIEGTKQKAKQLGESLEKEAEQKYKELMDQVKMEYKKKQEESKKLVSIEAAELVKRFIAKTVGLKPEAIDKALIEKAADAVKNET